MQHFGFQDKAPNLPTTSVEMEYASTQATGVVLDNWRNAKLALEEAKKIEKEAKDAVMAHIQSEIKDGVNRFKTNHYALKVNHSIKYSVNKTDLNSLNTALQSVANIEGADVAMALVQWSPTLSKKVYDSLSEQAKAFINPFLTSTYYDTFSIEENKE